MIVRASRRTSLWEERSAWWKHTASLPVSARIPATAALPFKGFRPTMVTRAPRAAKAFAVARPIPSVAPVTMATLPSKVGTPRSICSPPHDNRRDGSAPALSAIGSRACASVRRTSLHAVTAPGQRCKLHCGARIATVDGNLRGSGVAARKRYGTTALEVLAKRRGHCRRGRSGRSLVLWLDANVCIM